MADPRYSAYGIKPIGTIGDEIGAQTSVDMGLPSASYAYQQNSFRPSYKNPIDLNAYYGATATPGLSGKAYNASHGINSATGPSIANTNKNSNLFNAATTGLTNGYTQDSMSTLSNPDFAAWAGKNGIDLNGKTNDELAGLKQLQTGGSLDKNKTDWGMDGWGGFGIGLGQLGLGLASYLDNAKTAKAQRNLMGQQAKQNDYNYNKTVADNKHIQQIFNPSNK